MKKRSPADPPLGKGFHPWALSGILLLAVGYVVLFGWISVLRYHGFEYGDFDLAVHAHSIWLILHGSLENSILGIPFLGNHMNLILFFIAPLGAVLTAPLCLLLVQTIGLGAGVFPVYALAKERLGPALALLFGLSYLSYPALHFVNHFEFHPIALAVPFLLFMLLEWRRERFVPFLVWMVLALSCKENIFLGVLFLSAYSCFFEKRDRKWWLVPGAVALVWGGAALLIQRVLNAGTIDYGLIYRHLGTVPLWEVIFSQENFTFFLQLFLPLGFLPLLAPEFLLVGAPFFLQQLLSARPEDHTIQYHYTAKLIPFLFLAAILGAERLLKMGSGSLWRRLLWVGLPVALVVSNVWFGLSVNLPKRFSTHYVISDEDIKKRQLLEKIPKEASVVATFEFLPQLSQREQVYSFHHVYTGKYTLSRERDYLLPADVEYALLNFDDYLTFTSFHTPEQYRSLQRFFTLERWGLLEAVGNVGLFKKDHRSDKVLVEPLRRRQALGDLRLLVEENITMWGHRIWNSRVRAAEGVGLSFIWECVKQTSKDYWLMIQVRDEAGEVLHQLQHPINYRMPPTYAWKKGDLFQEHLWILIPNSVRSQVVQLKMLVFDRTTAGRKGQQQAQVVKVKANLPGAFDDEGWIRLGQVEVE